MIRILIVLFVIVSLSACLFNSDPGFDYPPSDRSLLKGPRFETLPEQTASVQQTVALPFQGHVRRFGSRYFLESYPSNPGDKPRWVILDSHKTLDLPARFFNTTFIDNTGNAWGLALKTDGPDTLYRFEAGQWKQYSLLSTEKYYGYIKEVLDKQFVFDTNEGVVVWDVPAKQRTELIPKSKARHFTASYMVGYENRTVLIHDRTTKQLLHSVQAGYELYDVHEDRQQRLWFVARDKNWDGLLYQYANKTSKLLTTVPVGNYDSARGVDQSFVDKVGNYWVRIEGLYAVYSPNGQWLKPTLPNSQRKQPIGRAFFTEQQQVIATDSRQLFTVSLP